MYFLVNFWKIWQKSYFQAEKTIFTFQKIIWWSFWGRGVGCVLTRNTLRYHPRLITIDMNEAILQNIFNFFEIFWLEILCFLKFSSFSKISGAQKFICFKIDRKLIRASLDLPLVWLGLNIHREKSYWIWKLAKVLFFLVNFWKIWKNPIFKPKNLFQFF